MQMVVMRLFIKRNRKFRNLKSYKIYAKNGFDTQYNDRIEKISHTQFKNIKLVTVMNITMTTLFVY